MRVRIVHEFEPVEEGRTLVRHGFRLFTPVPGRLRRPLCRKVVAADANANLERLRERIAEQAAASVAPPVAEPAAAS